MHNEILEIDGEKYLTPEQLSNRWGGKPTEETLGVWRHKKKGPKFVKLGRVLYRLSDVVEYENDI